MMPKLADADALRFGAVEPDAIYMGTDLVWEPADPNLVFLEDYEADALGDLTVRSPVNWVTVSPPQVVASGPSTGKALATVSDAYSAAQVAVPDADHWKISAKMSFTGTQTGHCFLFWVENDSNAYQADLQMRNGTSGSIWDRYNYGTETNGKSAFLWTAGTVIRLEWEWIEDVALYAHIFHGANLDGTVPDETLEYLNGNFANADATRIYIGNHQATGVAVTYDDVKLTVLP